jgi:hypothetical protein
MFLHKYLVVSLSVAKTSSGNAISSMGLAAVMHGEVGATKLISVGPPPLLLGSHPSNPADAKKAFAECAAYTIAARNAVSEVDLFIEENFNDPADLFALPPMLSLYDFDVELPLLEALGKVAGVDEFPGLPSFGQSIRSSIRALIEIERNLGETNYESEEAILESLHSSRGVVSEENVLGEAVRLAEIVGKVNNSSIKAVKTMLGAQEH